MSKQQKIEDYVPVLYNINFDTKKGCDSHTCKKGKCICMDEEQAGLVRKIYSEDDQIAMDLVDSRFVFRNLQQKCIDELVCNTTADTYGRGSLFKINGYIEEKFNQLLDALAKYGSNVIADVWNTIPVVFMVNSVQKIQDRNTLVDLCVYAPCPERYLFILFRAAICRTVGCCKNAKNDLEKTQYAQELAKLFCKLNDQFKQRSQIDRLRAVIREYARNCYNKEQGLIRNVANVLDEFEKQLRTGSGRKISDYDLAKCGNLYSILLKILQTGEMSIDSFPTLEFVKESTNATEYDEIVQILERVQHDKEKLASVLTELSNVFWKDVDVSSEALAKMENIAKFKEAG